MKFILTSLLFFCATFLSAQKTTSSTIKISGKIVSQKTLEPIPFAHIALTKSSIGTVTNQSGNFRLVLPNKYASGTLKISSIGFEGTIIKLASTKRHYELNIKLKESTKFLESIIITPVDEARRLVELAAYKIKDNYPSTKTQLEGFLRVTKRKGDDLAHVYETVLLVEKESYSSNKSSKEGKVKLINGRTIEAIELRYEFYGGHYLPHFSDFVYSKIGFINKSKINQYYYEILDSLKYNGNTIARVAFQSKKKKDEGVLFIDLDNNYALIKISYDHDVGKNIAEMIRGSNRLYSSYNVEYKKVNSLWYLSFIEYNYVD